jgi:hypothetical protein
MILLEVKKNYVNFLVGNNSDEYFNEFYSLNINHLSFS